MARDRAPWPGAAPARLFVAIEIEADAKARLQSVLDPWRERFPEARWVPSSNWHVTLAFLGPTWPRLMGWVDAKVAAVAASSSPFTTALDGLGAFPTTRRAKVVWAGLDDAGDHCASLAKGLSEALSQEFDLDRRPLRPHLTVARSDPPLELPEGFAATPLRTDPFRVDRLIVFRSILERPAARYEPVGIHPLGVLASEHVFE
jgi:RNA 2',3'-cyclic 3'-phosphodiesterase